MSLHIGSINVSLLYLSVRLCSCLSVFPSNPFVGSVNVSVFIFIDDFFFCFALMINVQTNKSFLI